LSQRAGGGKRHNRMGESRSTPIHVAIDAHMIGQRETGGERYMFDLIAGLIRVDAQNQYTLLATHPAALKRSLILPPNFDVQAVRPAANVPRVAWAMPRTCRRVGAQVLHVSYTAPPVCTCPTVVTVHDIAYEFFPQFFSPRDRWLLSTTVPLSCRLAARVIAVSEWTKRDLVRRYAIPEEKIRVVYEAAADRFSPDVPAEDVMRVRRQYAQGRRYVLAVGNIQPRKNLGRLVEAFAALAAQGTAGEDVLLVIVGQSQWRGSEVFQQVEMQGLTERVRFPGYVPDEDLPALYCGAEVFVYPSVYEGFGLPPLEGMACGTPVVCSNTSALPEVVGEAAALFDPYDVDALAQVLRDLLSNEARRQNLVAAGLARAAQFSWERAGQETVEVYREAVRA
jgi:glycosyltransferase involved in cell wall biosynthesis